jgi:hypothetical protein
VRKDSNFTLTKARLLLWTFCFSSFEWKHGTFEGKHVGSVSTPFLTGLLYEIEIHSFSHFSHLKNRSFMQGGREGHQGSPNKKKKIVYWSPHKKNTKVGPPPFVQLAPSLVLCNF